MYNNSRTEISVYWNQWGVLGAPVPAEFTGGQVKPAWLSVGPANVADHSGCCLDWGIMSLGA